MSRRTTEPRTPEVGTALAAAVSRIVDRLLRRIGPGSARRPFADAPWDDEPITDEDEAAIREAMQDPEPSIPWEKVKAEARRSA